MHYVFQEASITFFKKPHPDIRLGNTLSNYATKNQPGFLFFEERKRIFYSVLNLTNFANFLEEFTYFSKTKIWWWTRLKKP
jgi:hypothetical protein